MARRIGVRCNETVRAAQASIGNGAAGRGRLDYILTGPTSGQADCLLGDGWTSNQQKRYRGDAEDTE